MVVSGTAGPRDEKAGSGTHEIVPESPAPSMPQPPDVGSPLDIAKRCPCKVERVFGWLGFCNRLVVNQL